MPVLDFEKACGETFLWAELFLKGHSTVPGSRGLEGSRSRPGRRLLFGTKFLQKNENHRESPLNQWNSISNCWIIPVLNCWMKTPSHPSSKRRHGYVDRQAMFHRANYPPPQVLLHLLQFLRILHGFRTKKGRYPSVNKHPILNTQPKAP